MASIDRADWHYGGDYPKELPIENGGTHIGMYLTWIIDNDLIGSIHIEGSKEGIEDVKSRKITGRDFLFKYCDEKFWDDDLNEEGLAFTRFYYQNPDDPDKTYGQYILDYESCLGSQSESLYGIPNSWENYHDIAKIIKKRYKSWKNQGKHKSWKFWKN
jgi:hypothetical protein